MGGKYQREQRKQWYNDRVKTVKPPSYGGHEYTQIWIDDCPPEPEKSTMTHYWPKDIKTVRIEGKDYTRLELELAPQRIRDIFEEGMRHQQFNPPPMQNRLREINEYMDMEQQQRQRDEFMRQTQNYRTPSYNDWQKRDPSEHQRTPPIPVTKSLHGAHSIPDEIFREAQFIQLTFLTGTRSSSSKVFNKGQEQFDFIINNNAMMFAADLPPLEPGLFADQKMPTNINEAFTLQWVKSCRADPATLFFIGYQAA
jgi:hypothetical protein